MPRAVEDPPAERLSIQSHIKGTPSCRQNSKATLVLFPPTATHAFNHQRTATPGEATRSDLTRHAEVRLDSSRFAHDCHNRSSK
jgi:hypothetical protein